MKTIIKVFVLLVTVVLAGSVTMAQYHGGGRSYGGGHSYGDGHSYRGGYGYGGGYHGYGGGGGHYGYYYNGRGNLVFGLLGLGILAAAVAEHPVYAQPSTVVYQNTPPVVYYVNQAQPVYPIYQAPQEIQQPLPVQQPQVIYQAPPAVQRPVQTVTQVVQQPAVQPSVRVEPTQPVTMTINIQNSNGSFTPVTLHQDGAFWVGPKGEYYRGVPTVGDLRQLYGL